MEESTIVNYHHLAKIGIKEIFYFYDASGKWKWKEKMIETIDGQEWVYNSEDNTYFKRQTKTEEICIS